MDVENTKLRPYEKISQETRGGLIRSDNWNNNFNRVSDVIRDNNKIIEDNFTNISTSTIPSVPIEGLETSGDMLILQLVAIVNALSRKADDSIVDDKIKEMVTGITFNSNDGTFTFKRYNASDVVINTALEKVPATMRLEDKNVDGKIKPFLVITNIDGTSTETDVSKLFNEYTFVNTDAIEVSTDGYSITIGIKPHSITSDMLSVDIVSEIRTIYDNVNAALSATENYANAANASANKSASSATSANEAARMADEILTSVETNASNASVDAILSKSYAVGGTGTREGENTDNAKYYYEQAKATVSAGGLTVFIQSTEPDVNNCLWFKTANTNTQIGALLNVKDASGTVNEIYLITKAENVQGLSQFISNSLLGYAKKTDLDGYATESEVNTKLENYLPKSGGTLTGALTLKSAPTSDLQAATKKYVDDKAPLIIDASSITSAEIANSTINLINVALGNRDVILFQNSIPARYYSLSTVSTSSAIFASVENKKIYTATLSFDADSISYDIRNISATQRTVTLSSTGWTASGDVYTQSATVSGVSATETAQEIHITPATASMTVYMEAGVYASAQAANQITFTASEKPTADLTVYAVIRTL